MSIYHYDNTDQLTQASHDHQDNEEYRYDDNGNRTNEGYDTGDDNQLLTDGVHNYTYDGEGNRISQTEIATGEIIEYEWDYRNRLIGVVTKDRDGNVLKNIVYTYDLNNNRIAKSVDGEVERYVLDGDEIALVFDGDGNEIERYFHGVAIDEVLAVEKANDQVIWALTDHQGTVRVLMDNTGAVINQISYDSFGNVTAQTNAGTSFRFTYTGREFDEETGNYYYRARYYDSETGLFISNDPIGFDAGDSNLYRYVGNSPLIYTDPNGEDWYPVLNRLDQFAAGFADNVTFGQSTRFREWLYGDLAARNHQGGYFTAGRITGAVTTTALGFKTPANFAPGLTWAQKAAIGYEVAATGYGAYDATTKLLQGCFTALDALNFLPLAGYGANQLRNARKLGRFDDIGDATKNVRNASLRNQGKANNALESVLSCASSFIAGTEVLTPDGLVNIEDIEVGDWVISDDPNTPGEVTAKQVTRTFKRSDNNGIYDIAIGEQVVSSTGNHDYWILDEKLVAVEDLELGNSIIFDDPTTENVLESKQVLNISAKEDGSFELQLDDEIIRRMTTIRELKGHIDLKALY